MSEREVLQVFGANWSHFLKLGPIFTERVDSWAGVVSRRSKRKPESFPVESLSGSIYGFLLAATSRGSFRNGRSSSQPLSVVLSRGLRRQAQGLTVAVERSTKGELPHGEFVDSRCKDLSPRQASVVRRLANGEKLEDIADALGTSPRAVISTVSCLKGGAK